MENKKVFAGTFYGFNIYIECPPEKEDFITKQWANHTGQLVEAQKEQDAKNIELELASMGLYPHTRY
jgi:hypothetical protein